MGQKHALLVVGTVLLVEAGLGLVACGSSDAPADETDSGTTEAAAPDAGKDALGPRVDSGKVGNCSAVKGECDIVAQDCPQGQECTVTLSNGALVTACTNVEASEQLPLGHACCPSPSNNPCLPGLTCIGNACADGGPQTGRCSPACCKGDDTSCGKSDPEGISGACDVTLFLNNTEVHNVCSYRERCKPFGVEPCKQGEACLVEDKVGSASCTASTGGKQVGQPCFFANDCSDGLMCIGGADAGVCRMMCLTPNAVHPFDAGVEEGGPGAGGCPTSTCNGGPCCTIGVQDLPAWLSFCQLPDGG